MELLKFILNSLGHIHFVYMFRLSFENPLRDSGKTYTNVI